MFNNPVIGGILLVAGTAIGAGMLALPLTTGTAGFFPAALLIIGVFAYMLMTLFTLLEANLYLDDPNANIISMAHRLLGPWAQALAWLNFLLLLYAASTAYLSGGGELLMVLQAWLPGLTHTLATWIFLLVFGGIALLGVRWIDGLNRLLMVGLISTYLILTVSVAPHVQLKHLTLHNPSYLWNAVPIVALAFTSHIILPSLRSFLGNDLAKIKSVLFLGSIIPLAFYLVWELLVLGILPHAGPDSMISIARSPEPLNRLYAVMHNLNLGWIATNNQGFSFFALVTSFLGVLLSLNDFIADGLHIKRTLSGKLLLMLLSIGPPAFFALHGNQGFTAALKYAGIFVAILYGILPSLMVWKARYCDQRPRPAYQLPGGKTTLSLGLAGGVLIIVLQLMATNHLLPQVGA